MSSGQITIHRDGDWWVVSNDLGEFARATTVPMALSYVRCLMYETPEPLASLALAVAKQSQESS